jgi:uncharacterized lipoprotein YmbA
MRSRVAGPTLLAVLVALSAHWGCVSLRRTPEARFFVLRALAPTGASAAEPGTPAAASAETALVGLLPVRIPDHLARPQLVHWAGPNELRIDEFLRWSEPLDVAVTRTIAENLAALLPQARVVRDPWRAAVPLRCRVATDVTLFGARPDGSVGLEGRFLLLPPGGEQPLERRSFAFSREPLPAATRAADPGGAVAKMSELLLDLAREIATAYAALPPEPPVRQQTPPQPVR